VIAGGGPGALRIQNLGRLASDADLYAWQLDSPVLPPEIPSGFDLRAVGLQQLPPDVLGGPPGDAALVFAVNLYDTWANPAQIEVDVLVDIDGDGLPDFDVVSIDSGVLSTGEPNGVPATVVYDVAADAFVGDVFLTFAPMNSGTLLMPTLWSWIGARPFTYAVAVFDPAGVADLAGPAQWDPAAPSVSTGDYVLLEPGQTVDIPVATWQGGDARGWMVVSFDDPAGASQADLVPATWVAG
jgi:hypothetical protein